MAHLTTPAGDEDHFIGPQHPEITLVEYGSYDCPHCRQALAITLALLKECAVARSYVVHPDSSTD